MEVHDGKTRGFVSAQILVMMVMNETRNRTYGTVQYCIVQYLKEGQICATRTLNPIDNPKYQHVSTYLVD